MRILLTQKYTPCQVALESLGHEVRSFIEFPKARTLASMLEELHPFVPDLILIFYPELNSLPPDSLHCNIPIIPVVVDYHLNFQSLALAVPHFPSLIVNGKDIIPFFKEQGASNIFLHPMVLVDFPPIGSCDNERPYDILFVGQVDEVNFQERARFIQRLLELLPEYQVKILSGIDYYEAIELYRKSKIVFNHAVRPDVLNQRTLDALACGALLFVNEDNSGSLDWLKEDEEVVIYNVENVISKIRYYLENSEERALKAKKGQERLVSYRHLFRETQNQFEAFLQTNLKTWSLNQDATRALFASGLFLSPPEGLDSVSEQNEAVLNNLGVTYWSCATTASTPDDYERNAQKAFSLFQAALTKNANLLPVQWNLGRLLFWIQQHEQAAIHLNKALDLVKQNCDWPFFLRAISQHGMLDRLTTTFSTLLMQEKLYQHKIERAWRGAVLSGIFVPLIQISVSQKKQDAALQLISDWNRLDPTENLEREWLRLSVMRKGEKNVLELEILEIILKRPFSCPLTYLKNSALTLWQYGLKDPAVTLMTHLLKRAFAATWEPNQSAQLLDILKNPKKDSDTLEFLKNASTLRDFATQY